MEKNIIYKQDNLELMRSMDSNSVDLIYSDVLYGTNSKDITDYNDNLFSTPKDAIIFYKPRFIEMKRILKETGSIYIHCDWHLSHYLKVQLDLIFGYKNYKNEIIRQQTNAKNNSKNWGRIYDNILYYTKSVDNYTWNYIQEQKSDAELSKQYDKIDLNGNRYTTIPLHAKGESNGITGKDWNHPERGSIKIITGRHWSTTPDKLIELDKSGQIEWSKNNNPRKIQYAEDYDSKYIQNIWDLKSIGSRKSYVNKNGLIYDTQKPYDLLKRIILQSSNKGDLVFDGFCGSGTTLEVARDYERNYIGCDITDKSISICKTKLLNIYDL